MQAPSETTPLFLIMLLLEFSLVRTGQCPTHAEKIVYFDDIRPTSKTPVFCAVINDGVTQQTNKNLHDCSQGCAGSDACVGFNYKEPQLTCESFQTTFTNLTMIPGCIYYQKRGTPVTVTPPQASCYVRIHGYGVVGGATYTDDWYVAFAVNDIVYMNATFHTPPDAIGFFTYIVHPHNCSATDLQHFDTYNTDDSSRFISYLQALSDGDIIAGYSSDEPSVRFATADRDSLWTMTGVDIRPLGYRGKFVFLVQIGSPQKTAYELGAAGTAPAGIDLNIFIRGPTSDPQFVRVV